MLVESCFSAVVIIVRRENTFSTLSLLWLYADPTKMWKAVTKLDPLIHHILNMQYFMGYCVGYPVSKNCCASEFMENNRNSSYSYKYNCIALLMWCNAFYALALFPCLIGVSYRLTHRCAVMMHRI